MTAFRHHSRFRRVATEQEIESVAQRGKLGLRGAHLDDLGPEPRQLRLPLAEPLLLSVEPVLLRGDLPGLLFQPAALVLYGSYQRGGGRVGRLALRHRRRPGRRVPRLESVGEDHGLAPEEEVVEGDPEAAVPGAGKGPKSSPPVPSPSPSRALKVTSLIVVVPHTNKR